MAWLQGKPGRGWAPRKFSESTVSLSFDAPLSAYRVWEYIASVFWLISNARNAIPASTPKFAPRVNHLLNASSFIWDSLYIRTLLNTSRHITPVIGDARPFQFDCMFSFDLFRRHDIQIGVFAISLLPVAPRSFSHSGILTSSVKFKSVHRA